MKKSIILLCGMLCCFPAFAQEAEENQATWLVIPRFELNPYAAVRDGGYSGFDLAGSSLYTLFEGGIGDSNFSYTIETHLLSTNTSDLYQNTFRSDDINWLNNAFLTYTSGAWDFSAGKLTMLTGSFEIDEYDVDVTQNLASAFWSNAQVYQWGLEAGFTPGEGNTRFAAQVTTSPFGDKFFSSRQYAYSVLWSGEYGPFSTLTSFNLADCYGDRMKQIAFGGQLALTDAFTLGVDLSVRGFEALDEERTLVGTLSWEPSDSFRLLLKGGYEAASADVFGWDPLPDAAFADFYVPTSVAYMGAFQGRDYAFGGAEADYWPLEDLRLHAAAAYNNFAQSVSFTVGATYWFDLAKLLR